MHINSSKIDYFRFILDNLFLNVLHVEYVAITQKKNFELRIQGVHWGRKREVFCIGKIRTLKHKTTEWKVMLEI